MKITSSWLKDHLKTNANIEKIVSTLNNIGLEVESVGSADKNNFFFVAKIIKAEKHPNADKLKLCDVDIGSGKIVKVICGASNARDGLITVYAGPGAIIPKNQLKIKVTNIRGIDSYGMLCSESELGLSDDPTLSTSSPILFKVETIFSIFAFVFKWSFSQEEVIFIY